MPVLLRAASSPAPRLSPRASLRAGTRSPAISRWHSLPKGTGIFPQRFWERAPSLCTAKLCFPCPPLRGGRLTVKTGHQRMSAGLLSRK